MSTAEDVSRTAERPVSNRWWGAILLGICLAASLLALLYPAWIIQPFRAQGARELTVALAFIRLAPAVTLAAAVCGVLTVIASWPRAWIKRTGSLAAVGLLLASAVLARVDYFELMFHPNPDPRFVSSAQAAIDSDDMVMVAHSGAEAHAYPVRFMAYHHLVNDNIGGTPVVATY